MAVRSQPRVCVETSVLTLGWTDEHVDAYYHSLEMQKVMLRGQSGIIIPEYLERSGDAIFIRSILTPGRPISHFTPDSWSRKPGQLVVLAITCLEILAKVHSINTLHRNITSESVFLDSCDNKMLMTSYGVIKTTPDFETALHSYIPQRFNSADLHDILIYTPPLSESFLQTSGFAIHLTELRKFLAITPTERVRFNLRFSPLTDLYQMGFFLYKLLTQECPPSPFSLKYYDAEPGWKRARDDALKKLQKYSFGPFCNEFILRLLCLSESRIYLSAAEAHSDILNYWRALNANPAMLIEASLPKNMQKNPLSSEILVKRMLSMRLSFNDTHILTILKNISEVFPVEFRRVLFKTDISYVVECYAASHYSVELPEIYDIAGIKKAMLAFDNVKQENPALQQSLIVYHSAKAQSAARSLKKICCLAGLRGSGRSVLLGDLMRIIRDSLLGFCLYVPFRNIYGPLEFDIERNLYTCDASYHRSCHAYSDLIRKLPKNMQSIETPEQLREIESSAPNDGNCDGDNEVLSCISGPEWSPMLYLTKDDITCKLTHSYIEYGGEFHLIDLYLARCIAKLNDKYLLSSIRDKMSLNALVKLPFVLPSLSAAMNIPGQLEYAKTPVAVDYYESIFGIMVHAILAHTSIFVLVIDDLISECSKDFLKRFYSFVSNLSADRFYVIFSESLSPCIYPESFSWAGDPESVPDMNDDTVSPVSGKPYNRMKKILSSFKVLSRESPVHQASIKLQAQSTSDDARSATSVNSATSASVLSAGTKQSYVSGYTGSMHDSFQESKIKDLFARPYSFNLAVKRMLNPSYVLLDQVPDEMAQSFILKSLMLSPDNLEGKSGMQSINTVDLVDQILRKSGSIILNIKLLILTLYSISGITNSQIRYSKTALDAIPDVDQVILRRFHGLRNSKKLSDADMGILCVSSVFGTIFDMRWLTSALNYSNDDVILTSLTELSNMHLISCAPQFVQLRHPLYAQGSAEHGVDLAHNPYTSSKTSNRVGYVFLFNNISLCKVLEESFTSTMSQKLFLVALYLRKRWIARDSVLERKANLKPSLYIRNYDPKELETGELLRKLYLDFVSLLKISGKMTDVSLNDLQINKASLSLRIALRGQKTFFFDHNMGVNNWQQQEAFLKQMEADLQTPGTRACLLEQYDGLFVDITKLLRCLNPCASKLLDIYDQYELLRLNTYACDILSKSFADISRYLSMAKSAEHEIWHAMAMLCLSPMERQNWSLSNYKVAAQKRPLLIFKTANNLDIDSLLKCSIGVLSNPNSAHTSPVTSGNTDALSNKPNALQNLVSKAGPNGMDPTDMIDTMYGETTQIGSDSELTALYNAFPLLFNFTCANSICYSVQSIRFATRYNLVQSTYVTSKLSDEVYKHYWLELIWEWTLGMIQSNKPARAVTIAVSMLQKLFGDDVHINAFLPMITMNENIRRDTIVATLSLLFTTNLIEGNGLKSHPQAAITAAFDSLKSPSTPYALMQYMKKASLLERSVQKLLFLIFYALFLRDLTERYLSLAAAMVERCLLYGATIEGIAMIGILAAIAPSYIQELPKAAMFHIVKSVAEMLQLEEAKSQKTMGSAERSLQSFNFIPPLISCIFELTSIHILPHIDQNVRAHLTSYKQAIYLLPSEVVENVISQPLALCLYATSAFLSFRNADDLETLAFECQVAYNNLVAIKECVFNACIFVIARCCKYFRIRNEMALLEKENITFVSTKQSEKNTPTASSPEAPLNSKGAKEIHKESLPEFDSIAILSIQYMRSDATLLPSKLVCSVLLEAYARAGLLVKALYVARRVLQIFPPTSYGFINMLTFTRVALVHIAVVDTAVISQKSADYLAQSLLDIIYRSTGFKGAYKRMADVIIAGLTYIRGCHISNVLSILSQHKDLKPNSKPLQEQLSESGARFFLDVLLTT